MNFVRKVLTYDVSVGIGILGAAFVSWLVGLVWKPASGPVFYVLAIGWIWVAWSYAKARDKSQF